MAQAMGLGGDLTPLRRRVRILLAEQSALRFGAVAALAALLPAIMDKLHWLRADWPILLSGIAGAFIIGWLWGRFRPLADFDIARACETRLSLKERLSSAVCLEISASELPLVAALVEDASCHLLPLQPELVFPRKFSRPAKHFLGALLLLAAVIILPELSLFHSAGARRERAELRRQGTRLVELSREMAKAPLPADKKALQLQIAHNLKTLGKDLQAGRLDRKQALLKLDKLEEQIAQAEKNILNPSASKSYANAALQMQTGQQALDKARFAQRADLLAKIADAKSGKGPQLSAEQMKALEKLAENLAASPSQQLLEMDESLAALIAELLAKGDTQQALEIMQKLAEKLQDDQTLKQLTPEELKQLAEELKQLAESLKDTDLDALAKELLETAKALERGDLKLCKSCAGKAKKIALGLGGKCRAGLRLAGLGASLGQCRGGLQGRGVGPGDGQAQYDANASHQVNRGEASRIPAQHYDTKIPGQIGDSGEAYSVSILGEPDQPGKAKVPYYEVYSDYQKSAESALDREEVPPAYRDKVKDYFTSLKPEKP
jgi:hypothetical protein